MAETMNLADIRQRAKLPAKQAGGKTVQAFFDHNKGSLSAVLPKHVSADRLMKIALGAMRQTPKLMECSVESLFGALVWCAQLGVEPNTPMGQAYLIPFKKKGVMEVQCIIGYRGMIDLARRSGQILSIAAHEVCANDEFEFSYGLDEKLSHKPALSARGPVIAYYAVAKLVGGGYAFEVMSVEQIDAIRDREGSNAWKDIWENGRPSGRREKASSPWWDHPVEMGRKTVIRRLFKYLPVSIELCDAVQADDSFGKQKFDNVLEGDANVVEDAPEQEDVPALTEQQPVVVPPMQAKAEAHTHVDRETGEIQEPQRRHAEQPNGPTFADAQAAVREGDFDLARDIGRSLPPAQRQQIEAAISNLSAPPAEERSSPAPTQQAPATRRSRGQGGLGLE